MSTKTNKETGKTGGLEKMQFDIRIQAPVQKVWQVLWDDTTYRQWTNPFSEGSYAVSDWKQGSKVHFLTPKGEGMYSEIMVNKQNELMTFKHLGELKDFKEQPESEWSGSTESYSLKEENGATKLHVSLDATSEFKEYFGNTFPIALAIAKELAEKPLEITVATMVAAPVEKVWKLWTTPGDITKWNSASDDWHTPRAENDLRTGGKFLSRMEAKDGSFGFDFEGAYDEVKKNELIAYTMSDGRKVKVVFTSQGNSTKVVETFEAESENSIELQRGGWQAILDSFKKYAEANS